ncbi:MAG: Spy/CpxP family protein refolding chaperone [Armatimonadota bacterium]
MRKSLMKLFIALLILSTGVAAFAQRQEPPLRRTAGGPVGSRSVFKELGLSPEQVQKITGIVREYRMNVGAVLSSNASESEKKKRITSLKSKASADILKVLTPAQQRQAKEKGLIDQLLERVPGDHQRFLGFLEQLSLSEEQKKKVKVILDDSRAKTTAVMNNPSLTRDQKLTKIAEIRKQTIDKIRSLLTPEQKKKLDELLRSRLRLGPSSRIPTNTASTNKW